MITKNTITYIAKIKREGNTLLICFPDLPEANTFVKVKHREDAAKTAIDCLLTALNSRIRDKQSFPMPSFIDVTVKNFHKRLICTVNRAPFEGYLSFELNATITLDGADTHD